MTAATKKLVLEWLADYGGDKERLARYMRDTIRIGGIRKCRQLIEQACEDEQCT